MNIAVDVNLSISFSFHCLFNKASVTLIKLRSLLLASALFIISLTTLAENHLVIAYSHYPPFQWVDDKGLVQGIDIDIADAVFNDAGFTTSYKQMPWARQLQVGIKNGEIDVLLQSKHTLERESFAYFSDDMYLRSSNFMFIRQQDHAKFNRIKQLEDLIDTDLRVAMSRGSTYSESHAKLQRQPAFSRHFIEVSKDEQSLFMLLTGRVDAIFANDLSMAYLLGDKPQINTIIPHLYLNKKDSLKKGPQFMFSKASMTPAQVDRINRSLKKLLSNGTIDKIIAKYGISAPVVNAQSTSSQP